MKTRINSSILQRAAMMLLATLFCATRFWAYSGSGTQNDPYLISTMTDWSDFALKVRTENAIYGSAYYKLEADISIDTECNLNSDAGLKYYFGDQAGPFRGHFDGGGHTLTFNFETLYNKCAPFRGVDGATIENLNVAGKIIGTGNRYNAAIVGYSTGSTTIRNCTVTASIKVGYGKSGGIVGGAEGTLTLDHCIFKGSLTSGTVYFPNGGLVGSSNYANINITDCLFDPVKVDIAAPNFYVICNIIEGRHSTFDRAYTKYYRSNGMQGTMLYTESSDSRLTKKITAADGNDYWAAGSAAFTGLNSTYDLQGSEIGIPTCGVSFNRTALTSADYDITLKNSSDVQVSSITATGVYTMTATLKGNYTGSISKTFLVYTRENVPYIDADGADQIHAAVLLTTTTDPEWWYVTGDVAIDSRLNISGQKHLIICDGATLTISKGIQLASGNSLTIYGQSENTGKLIINGVDAYCAGIGSRNGQNSGTLTINGGDITVQGGVSGAGIGGGGNGANGTVIINGGKVTATGGSQGAGIGGGGYNYDHTDSNSNGGTIVINGGVVAAFKGNFGFGMGGGTKCTDKGTVSINLKNTTDRVYADSYNSSSITITGNYVLDGTSTLATSSNIGGKTIVPAKSVTLGTTTNGTAMLAGGAASGSYFGIGNSVSLIVKPNAGYAVENVSYNGNAIASGNDFGVYSFTMPSTDVNVTATFREEEDNVLNYGSANNPYIICNVNEWNAFSSMVSVGVNANKCFKLSSAFDNSTSITTMVGTSGHPFAGVFDGNGQTLNIALTSNTATAPFQYISGATIKNLTVAGSCNGNDHSAGLVGFSQGGTTEAPNLIENCTVSTQVTITNQYGGGIVGHGKTSYLTIKDCIFNGAIDISGLPYGYVGGLMGWCDGNTLTIEHSLFNGTYSYCNKFHPIACRDNGKTMSYTNNGAYYTVAPTFTDDNYIAATGTLCMVMEDAGDNSSALTSNNNLTKAVFMLGRTLYKDGDWNTLCLPFGVSSFTGTPLEGATVKELLTTSNLDSDGKLTLNFSDNLSAIEAGKPYIVKWASGDNIVNPVFQNVTITKAAPTAVSFSNALGDDCQFVGQYSPFTINDSNRDQIVLLSSGSKLGYSKNNRTLKACRAHFLIPTTTSGNGARSFQLNFDGEATGIIETIGDESDALTTGAKNSGWYDMSGRKLSGKPTQKGLYIYNGKKVVIQ